MTTQEQDDEMLYSQLADGELENDLANEVLLNAMDVAEAREKLKAMLRLRQATRKWRDLRPMRPNVIAAARSVALRRRLPWQLGSLSIAACVGGLLALSCVWAAGWADRSAHSLNQPYVAQSSGHSPRQTVTAEQMQQVARVFALHESVAGPLAWYAADDQTVRLSSAQDAQASQDAIAVLLRLEPASPGGTARKLVVVCREQQSAVVDLPSESAGQSSMRVYLSPRAVNGKIDVQFAIAVGDSRSPAAASSLSGQRNVGATETPLGQLAFGDKLMNVDACAWAMRDAH